MQGERGASFPPQRGRDATSPTAFDGRRTRLEFTVVDSLPNRAAPVVEFVPCDAFVPAPAELAIVADDERPGISQVDWEKAWRRWMQENADDSRLPDAAHPDLQHQITQEIAHDLKNMLSIVLGHAELCLLDPSLAPRTRASARAILDSAGAAAEVVRRISTGQMPTPDRERPLIDLNAIVARAVARLDAARQVIRPIDTGRVRVSVRLAPLPSIPGDDTELGQVIINLVLNALDAMPSGGELNVATSFVDGQAVVEVGDTGVGMSQELQQRVFDPYFTTKGEMGTGLGLGICKRIIQEHRGEITLSSTPGAGTTFTIRLPIHPTSDVGERHVAPMQSSTPPPPRPSEDDEPSRETRALLEIAS